MNSGYQQSKMLVELAALAAYHGNAFLNSVSAISRAGIETYWLASRNRMDAWSTEMKRLESVTAERAKQGKFEVDDALWMSLAALNEEIMISEVLTRVWTTLGCQFDRGSETHEAEPFVRSVFTGHLEARHRLMRLAFEKMNLSAVQARRADRVRRHAERWTDVLLGYLASTCETDEFAFEPDRVADFATSLCGHHAPGLAQSLLMVSLKSTFEDGFLDRCPNPGYNREIAAAVLACYGPDVFDSIGLFKTIWQTRLSNIARDTQGMLDCLIAEHQPSPRWNTNEPKS